jgi:hypothetical protein
MGQTVYLKIQHDATANVYAILWPGSVKRAGGAFANTNAASAIDTLLMKRDTNNWYELGRP